METKSEHLKSKTSGQKARKSERGNALIYVLVAIALFAALSFTLSRQTDSGEAGTISEDRAELYASQLISYASQAKSVIDQMMFMGAEIDDLDFTLPSDAAFETPPNIYKVYHPDGGGLNLGRIPEEIKAPAPASVNDPDWYLGRFNSFDWTSTTADDVVLVAYQINETVCRVINKKINGSTNIPQIANSFTEVFIDEAIHFNTNIDFTTGGGVCANPACNNASSLCVMNGAGNAYAFFSVLADQ